MYGDKGYLFHNGSNIARRIEAWIQKEMISTQYHGCTVAHEDFFPKPKGNETDAMLLSQSSGGSRPGPNP